MRSKAKSKTAPAADSAANLGFKAKLWVVADKLRNHLDAAKYKHVCGSAVSIHPLIMNAVFE